MLTLGKTSILTIRCYCRIGHLGVTKCLSLVCNVAVAAGAGVCGVTCLSAGGISYYCLIVVTERRNDLLSYGNGTADRAVLTLGKTSILTIRCYCRVDHLGVTVSGDDLLCYGSNVTYGTVLTLGKAGLGAGRCLALDGLFGVTERGNDLLSLDNGTAISTIGAYGKAGLSAGGCYRRNLDGSVHVGSRDLNALLNYFTANGAYDLLGMSGSITGSFQIFNCGFLGMTEGVGLTIVVAVTARTSVSGVSAVGAGGINNSLNVRVLSDASPRTLISRVCQMMEISVVAGQAAVNEGTVSVLESGGIYGDGGIRGFRRTTTLSDLIGDSL